MSGWREATLREAGISLIDCDHRTPPASETGYPYIAIPQLKQGRVDLTSVRRITREQFLEWTRKAKPQPHDVILSRRCNPGETAVVPEGLECALGQNLVLLRADPGKVFPPFLRWLVRSGEWWEQIGKFLNVGAVFDSLKCGDIPNFCLPIPPLPEQRAIASVLGALDNKIELNRRMNETLEALAQSLFKSWFVDATQDCLPKGWRQAKVSDLATLSRDGLNPGEFPEETFDHYSIPAFDEGRTPKTEIGDTIKSNKFIVPSGCVMVSKLNPRIPRVWLPDLRGRNRAVCSTEFLVATPKPAVSREFLFCLFKEESFVSVFGTMVTGTSGSHQRVKPESLLGMHVVIPPQPLVQEFTNTAAPLLRRISHNIAESYTLAALRDALLPKLLSGELRVAA